MMPASFSRFRSKSRPKCAATAAILIAPIQGLRASCGRCPGSGRFERIAARVLAGPAWSADGGCHVLREVLGVPGNGGEPAGTPGMQPGQAKEIQAWHGRDAAAMRGVAGAVEDTHLYP